jgi:dipeptidyl aminopeptidase/acylaminoacyl peptidase
MSNKIIFYFIINFFILNNIYANDNFGNKFKEVNIESSIDNSIQKSIVFYADRQNRPLIVSLHPWSSDYSGRDILSEFAKENNINYIHPDFRGKNNTFNACCSKFAVKDIDDSIKFMIQQNNIDMSNITVVGVSGGGYATLCSYFKTEYKIKQFISFAAITNLEDWYYEMKKRGATYATDIMNCTNSKQNLNLKEIQKRSPIYFPINKNTFNNSKLYILHGIHDGFTGSVSIAHSINMYNSIVKKDGGVHLV